MNQVTPIRGQPKNLERHIRTCQNSKTAASQLEPITSLSQLPTDAPHTPTPTPNPNIQPNLESPPAQLISLSNVAQSSTTGGMIPLAQAGVDTPAREGRLSRQKQAELDADIYNLFTQLGIPFDDQNCSNFGAFVGKWIPGARWGTEDR